MAENIDLTKPHWKCVCGCVAMPLTDDTECNCKDIYEQDWRHVPAGNCVFQPDPAFRAYCLYCGWVKSAHRANDAVSGEGIHVAGAEVLHVAPDAAPIP